MHLQMHLQVVCQNICYKHPYRHKKQAKTANKMRFAPPYGQSYILKALFNCQIYRYLSLYLNFEYKKRYIFELIYSIKTSQDILKVMDSTQPYEEMNIKEAILKRAIIGCRRIFEKTKFFFLSQQKRSQHAYPLEAQIQLPLKIYSEPFPKALSDRIRLYSMIGYQVSIKILSEEIPEGCIGILSCLNEGILEYRQYLMLQVEYVEKKTIVFLKI